jgi:hypothetical protein
MKRDPALAALSRDHHQALVVAKKLRDATSQNADEARAAYLDYWEQHGAAHFRLEEEILLPAYAAHANPYHPLIARSLCDHVAIRQRADALLHEPAPAASDLHNLGRLLADHVRREERELFPLIERAVPPDRLAVLAIALDQAEGIAAACSIGRRQP